MSATTSAEKTTKKKAKVKVYKKKRGEPESKVIQKLQEKYDSVSSFYLFHYS